MALAASMTLFTACTDNNEPGNGDGGEDNKYELTKDIESDTELEAGRDSMFSWPGSLTTTLLILIPSIVFFLNKLRYFYYHTSMQKIIIRPGSHLRKLGRKSHGMINLLK